MSLLGRATGVTPIDEHLRPPRMPATTWEYIRVRMPRTDEASETLSQLGAVGWEVVPLEFVTATSGSLPGGLVTVILRRPTGIILPTGEVLADESDMATV
jgi:hypothetical protein